MMRAGPTGKLAGMRFKPTSAKRLVAIGNVSGYGYM
jgi:hypothetical protein